MLAKFQLPRYRGNSMAHTLGGGISQGASMGQTAVTSNLMGNPAKHSWTWLREKPVSDSSLCRTSEIRLIRLNQKVRSTGRGNDERVCLDYLPLPVKSRNLHPAQNDNAERSNHHMYSLAIEQVASRKSYDGRIVSEANAWGNAQDRLTEARYLGR